MQFLSDGSEAKDVKEFLPYVELGECANVYCADTGVLLDRGEVKKGRTREISELAQHVAWRYVLPGSVKGAKVVKMKWVDRVASGRPRRGRCP